MPIPILKQDDLLIASIQSAPTDQDLIGLRDEIASRIGRHRSRGVIVDVAALDVLDSFATRTLRGIAQTARLRGAEAVVVGIQPDVAVAMVRLGVTFDDVAVALDLEEGITHLRRARQRGRRGG